MSENEILIEMWKLCPNRIINKDSIIQVIPGKRNKVLLIKELTVLDKDVYIDCAQIPKKFSRFGLIKGITTQLYYDFLILRIKSIEDRPKCTVCGINYCNFRSFKEGYNMTCGNSCIIKLRRDLMDKNHEILRNKPVSEETRRKLSLARKGKVPPKKAIDGARNWHLKFSKTEEGKEFYKKLGESNSKRNIKAIIDGKFNSTKSGKSKFKRGKYYSPGLNKNFHYDSSWELDFLKYLEKDLKKGYIQTFKRCSKYFKYKDASGKVRRYIPDFYIKLDTGLEIIVEIKPYEISRKDLILRKKYSAKKGLKGTGIKYLIITEKELYLRKGQKYNNKKHSIKDSFHIFNFL